MTKKTQTNKYLYGVSVSVIFAPLSGTLFSITCGLTQPYEMELYWIEHYIGAFINPLVLALMGRYYDRQYFNIHYRIIVINNFIF